MTMLRMHTIIASVGRRARAASSSTPRPRWHDPPGTTIGEGANADGRQRGDNVSANGEFRWP